MKATLNIGSVTMPAGLYWLGDPCYSVPDDRWMEWLEAAEYDRQPYPRYLLAELDGHPVLGIGTAWGDGAYSGSDGNLYPVDAGLLGITPVEVVTEQPFGSQLVNFPKDFECSYDNGNIILGHIVIETGESAEEEEEGDHYV